MLFLFGPAMSSAIFQQVPIYRAIRPLIKALFNCWHQMDRWQYGDDLGWQDFCKSTRKAFFSTMPPFHWWKVVLDQLKCSKLYEVKMGIWCFRIIYPYQPVWDFLHFQPVNTKTQLPGTPWQATAARIISWSIGPPAICIYLLGKIWQQISVSILGPFGVLFWFARNDRDKRSTTWNRSVPWPCCPEGSHCHFFGHESTAVKLKCW